jgi:hypothetical protein
MSVGVWRVSVSNASGLASGIATMRPRSSLASIASTTRRTSSTGSSSSPWMPAVMPTVGPSWRPSMV